MNRDTAIACWYRRVDPACFTDQSSSSMYAYSGELTAPALAAQTDRWASSPTITMAWSDTPSVADLAPHPLLSAISDWFAALVSFWRRPLSSQRQPR